MAGEIGGGVAGAAVASFEVGGLEVVFPIVSTALAIPIFAVNIAAFGAVGKVKMENIYDRYFTEDLYKSKAWGNAR